MKLMDRLPESFEPAGTVEGGSMQRMVSPGWFVFEKHAKRETQNNWSKYAGPFATLAEAREWRDKQPGNQWMRCGRLVIELEAGANR